MGKNQGEIEFKKSDRGSMAIKGTKARAGFPSQIVSLFLFGYLIRHFDRS